MSWLHTLAMIFHMLFAASIVGLVLLQRGKGAEAGAGFGAGASGTVFGARGTTSFLSRATGIVATLFFVTSLSLAYLGSKPATQSSVMDKLPAQTQAPATTTTLPPADVPPLPEAVKSEPAKPAPAPETAK